MKLVAILSEARNKVLAKSKVLILLYCYIVIFSFGQLTRISWPLPEINIHLADIIVGLLVSTWLIWKLIKREKFIFPPLTNQILLFFLLAGVSLALNSSFLASGIRKGNLLEGREMMVAWLYLVRWIFYSGFYFIIFDLNQKSKNFHLEAKNMLIGAGLITAFLGLCQYFFLPDTRFLESFGWDPHYFRLIGTFLDPGFTGAILALTMVLIFSSYFLSREEKKKRILVFIGLVVYVALALTYSRASYLAYLLGAGIMAYFLKKPKFFLVVLVVLVVTLFLLPRPGGEGVRLERESTIKFRIINWCQSLIVAKDHLVWGVGFNAYRYTQRDYGFLEFANWRASHAGGGADSSLLFVLATTGIFGFLAYLWLWGKAFVLSVKTPSLPVVASIVALLVHSWFVNSLFYPWIMAWMWILLGASHTKERKQS